MVAPGRIGRFELGQKLGGGAMGSVHRALDRDTGKMVAIKTAIANSHAQVESLRAEIAALARLSHPGIVPIVAHGVDGETPFIAMELLEGKTLAETLILGRPLSGPRGPGGTMIVPDPPRAVDAKKQTERPPANPRLAIPFDQARFDRICRVFVKLARTLAYLHGEGVVHRDLKPDNIVMVGDDEPIVVDFGLARFRFGQTRETVRVERGATGTPYYMSPEQITNQLLDARTDLYALGAVFHHAIVGQPPFVADDLVVLFHMHRESPPPVLSELVPGVPAPIDELVLSLLEKKRSRRLAYAEDFVEALASITNDVPGIRSEPSPRPYVYGSDCVGRIAELATLSELIDEALAGNGRVLLLRGESGVGKTRFLSEGLSRIPAGAVVLTGQAEPHVGDDTPSEMGKTTLSALRPVLQWLADHARAGYSMRVKGWLGPSAALLALYEPQLLGLVDALESPPLPPQEAWNDELARALVRVVLEVASSRPTVIVIDDAQWADDATRRFVEQLIASPLLAEKNALLVAGFRAEEEPAWARSARATPSPRVSAIELLPLAEPEMRELGSAMLGSKSGARALERIIEIAQGNPFTLAETIRSAVEDGTLVREGRGRWAVFAESTFFSALDAASEGNAERIARIRIESLGTSARRLAQVASVIARPASLALLGAISELPDVESALAELIRRGLAIESSAGAWSLAHDKIRERAHATLSDDERRTVHLALARALLAEPSPTAEDIALRASHFHHAGANVSAAREALRAVDAFEQRSSGHEAERCAESAWAFASDTDRDQAPLSEIVDIRGAAAARLGALRATHGRLDEALPLLQIATDLASTGDDAASLATAHGGLAYVAYLQGRETELFEHARAAHRAATASGDDRLLGRAENTLGIAFGSSGSFRQAIEHYTRAAGFAERASDVAAVGKHWSNISINFRLLGDLSSARAAAERAVSLTTPSALAHANAWANLGRVLIDQGALEVADSALERAIGIARKVGIDFVVAEAEWGRAMVHLALGEPHVATRHAEHALELSKTAGLTVNEGMALRALGLVALVDGAERGLERARNLLDESVRLLETTQEQNELADSLVDLALALARLGLRDEALAARARAGAIYEKLDMKGRLLAIGGEPEWMA